MTTNKLSAEAVADIARFQVQRRKNPVPEDAWLCVAEIDRLLADREVLEAENRQLAESNDRLAAELYTAREQRGVLQAELQEAREQRDAYLNGLDSIRDCTSDMWACSMAGSIAKGVSFADALKAAHKYDQDGGLSADGIRTDAINGFRAQLVAAVRASDGPEQHLWLKSEAAALIEQFNAEGEGE